MEISKGNLRFAIIATKVMLGENKQYKKLSEVVQSFYKGLEKELDFNSNEDYSNFVAALSFFGTIDIDGDDTVDLLSKVFKFKKENIAKHISFGYEKEVINISEDGKIIEITDQVFAAYLCYKSIYINRTLSLKEIFISFFDEHQEYKGKVVNLVQDIIDIYYPDNKQIEEDLKSILDSLVIKADINGTITFLSRFHQLFPEESINYSYQYLLNEHTKNETLQSNLISLLFKNFNDNKYYKTIIDKYISLLLHCPNIKNVLVQGITQNVNISRKSLKNDYASEIYFVEEIIQNNITDNDVLSSLINCLISYEREEYETDKSKSVMFIRFTVVASKGFQSLREKMWIIIERLINNGCFDSISHKYNDNSYCLPNDTYELRKIDLEFALKAVSKIDLCHMKNKMLAIEILSAN